jgi:hypothetical protein
VICRERLIMLALQFAIATVNLASQNAFLFLATHSPIFIASSSSATLIQCGFQYRRWNCSHPPTRCEDDRFFQPETATCTFLGFKLSRVVPSEPKGKARHNFNCGTYFRNQHLLFATSNLLFATSNLLFATSNRSIKLGKPEPIRQIGV